MVILKVIAIRLGANIMRFSQDDFAGSHCLNDNIKWVNQLHCSIAVWLTTSVSTVNTVYLMKKEATHSAAHPLNLHIGRAAVALFQCGSGEQSTVALHVSELPCTLHCCPCELCAASARASVGLWKCWHSSSQHWTPAQCMVNYALVQS